MADRIFPNTYQEEPLDSDLVFKGIDWDNFNERLAEAKEPKENKGLKALLDAIGEENVDKLQGQDDDKESSDDNLKKEAKKGLPPGLKKWMEEHGKGTKKAESDDDESDEEDTEAEDKKSKMEKKASPIVFNHPSQLSAEAVEAAIAAGDEPLKNAILAARHERRVRLASKIEAQIEAENEINTKLAQRRAYRESLVSRVANADAASKVAETKDEGFVKISQASNSAKLAFAQKALAEGFPQEYVDAILGNNEPEVDNTSEIRNIMSSDLSMNVKKSAVTSMVKTATLSNADYARLIKYWKEELGYGDQEWIDALFTKKYD